MRSEGRKFYAGRSRRRPRPASRVPTTAEATAAPRDMSKNREARRKSENGGSRQDERVSLAPLTLEEAIEGLLQVQPPKAREQQEPPPKKRPRKKQTKNAGPPTQAARRLWRRNPQVAADFAGEVVVNLGMARDR